MGFKSCCTYLKGVIQVGFIVYLRRPDSTLLAKLEILYRQTLDDKVPIQTAGSSPVRQWPGSSGLYQRSVFGSMRIRRLLWTRSGSWTRHTEAQARPRSCKALAEPTNEADALEAGVVEASKSGCTCRGRLVIHKRTITLGDEKHAFNVVGCFLREMVFEIHHARPGW